MPVLALSLLTISALAVLALSLLTISALLIKLKAFIVLPVKKANTYFPAYPQIENSTIKDGHPRNIPLP
jgi:hypothetical protein